MCAAKPFVGRKKAAVDGLIPVSIAGVRGLDTPIHSGRVPCIRTFIFNITPGVILGPRRLIARLKASVKGFQTSY